MFLNGVHASGHMAQNTLVCIIFLHVSVLGGQVSMVLTRIWGYFDRTAAHIYTLIPCFPLPLQYSRHFTLLW